MEINCNNGIQSNLNKKKEYSVLQPPNCAADNIEEHLYPNQSVMRAYANIHTKNNQVSRQEALDFIHSTGCKYEARCEQFLQNLTDSDGYIKQETFEWAKNCFEKNKKLFLAMNLIENSKEDCKINHKMLELLEPALPEMGGNSYGTSGYFDIPKYFKDKNGKFNNDVIKILKPYVEKSPKMILIRPDYLSKAYMTSDNEFDLEAIRYHLKNRDKELKPVQNDIWSGKDKNGKFSQERLSIYKELEPTLEKWQITKALNLTDKVSDKKSFMELAKTMREDKSLYDIFEIIENLKNDENLKSGLEYDKESVEFIKELEKSTYGRKQYIPAILKKINIPYKNFTEENMDMIKDLFCTIREGQDIEPLLDASVYKAGDKKGQFSFKNLKRYMDIYNSDMKNISEVKYISGILSLEEDDRALDTISKVYNLSWEREGVYGTNFTDRVDRHSLHFIFDLSTIQKNNVPQRKFLPNILENFENLMKMRLPMTSAKAFENFMTFPEIDIVEKLEKVRLDEIGINTGDLTNEKFKSASEEELYAFKDYMTKFLKDKNGKYVNVDLNYNIADLIEVKNNSSSKQESVLYNMKKQKPVAKRTTIDGLYNVQKEFNDYEKNTVVKQLFRRISENYSDYEYLINQTVEKYDKNNKLLYTETMKESDIDGVFNVVKTYPDGRVEDLVKAQRLENGNVLIEKNLTSADGVKTIFRYEDDVQGNRIMDYKIIDTDGKILMDQSSSFEVVDENHFISSRNNKKFDIKFDNDFVHVKDCQTGKIADINLVNFTNSTQKDIIPLLKKIPGDEIFEMKEFNLKSLSLNNGFSNAAYSPKDELIGINEKYLDAGVLLHEWGHGKDELSFKEISEKIADEPNLIADYEKEKSAVRELRSEAELEHFAYFGADYHYLGSKKIKEGVAETNILLDIVPQHRVNSVRAHYWMQDFPRVIARLSKLLH